MVVMQLSLLRVWSIISPYPADSQKILVFDKYDVSAKDHERMRRAGEGSTYYNLTINSPVPNGGAIMKNNHNKHRLSRFISCSNLGANITLKSRHDGGFSHDQADITMIAYLVQEAECDWVMRILSDDIDMFV